MTFSSRVVEVLNTPLFELSGGRVTIGSLLVGIVIVLAFRLVAVLLSKATLRVLERRAVHGGARFAMAKIMRYVLMVVGILVGLSSVGLRLDALFAASAVLLVGIGFGLQSIAQNFLSGLILLVERPVSKGDFVRIGDAFGSVEDIGLRATKVITRDEVTIFVPNSQLINGVVINHSVPTPSLRVSITVGVAYGSDTALIQATLFEVAHDEPAVLREPAPEVRFDDFGESSLDFTLLVWISHPREDRVIASRIRFAIEAAFRRTGIAIPFPQRDVHVVSALRPGDRPAPSA